MIVLFIFVCPFIFTLPSISKVAFKVRISPLLNVTANIKITDSYSDQIQFNICFEMLNCI